MHIVIPMAGAGSRFQIAGYTLPKPFIDVNGKMMIEHVLDGLQVEGADYTLIIQEQFKKEHQSKLDALRQKYKVNFVAVEKLTQGASCTALAAHKIINTDEPVLFADSDNFFKNETFKKFVQDAKERNLDGSLLTFNTQESCFSFAKTNEKGFVTQTREKEAISNHAITGVYFFAKGSNFVDCAIDMMIYGDRAKNEYYMSNAYNWAIKKGLKIGVYDIASSDWACVGTPAQLQEYLGK